MRKLSLVVLFALVVALCVCGSAFAAAKKSTSSQTKSASPSFPAIESIGIVDRGEILNNHPNLKNVRQQLADIEKKKANEAKALADKETDNNKKAQAYQTKRMELAQEEQRLMAPIYHDCEQAVREVSARKKIVLVLDKFVVLIGGVDITQDVIQQLAKKK